MNHVSRIFTLGLIAVAVALPAQAARPTYSYLDLAYVDTQFKDAGGNEAEADGGRFNFNVSLQNWMYFTGEYNHVDFDSSSIQLRDTSLGLGAHTLGRDLQFFAAATYESAYVFGSGETEEGYATQFGLRWPVMESIEVGADAKFVDFGGGNRDERYRLTVQGRLSPTWSTIATYQAVDRPGITETDFTIGFRAYFITQYDLPPRRTSSKP